MTTGHPQDDDPFGPPEQPTQVHCLHCDRDYMSDLIQWCEDVVDGQVSGFWRCPTPGCDGAGFGFDIFPTDPDWVDPTGRLQYIDADEDDDEFDDDSDEDSEDADDAETGDEEGEPFADSAWAQPADGKVMDYMARHPGAVFEPGAGAAGKRAKQTGQDDEPPPEADPFVMAERADKDYIEGIFNYCDRWCERCPFTARCLLYDTSEAAFPDKADRDINNERFWKRFGKLMTRAIGKLREEAERRGIDLDDVDPEAVGEERKREAEAKGHPLARSSFRYAMDAKEWFEAGQTLIEQYRQELIRSAEMELPGDDPRGRAVRAGDAFEVIQWHMFQIHVKLRRALHGDDEELLDDDGVPYPSDRDGSAKVALIGIDRSLAAWGVLYEELPEASDQVLDFLVRLHRLRKLAEETFPNARGFVRPGFDAPAGP